MSLSERYGLPCQNRLTQCGNPLRLQLTDQSGLRLNLLGRLRRNRRVLGKLVHDGGAYARPLCSGEPRIAIISVRGISPLRTKHQQGTDHQKQCAPLSRLGADTVVRAPFGRDWRCCVQNNGNVAGLWVSSQAPAELEARHVGHHVIDNQQIRQVLPYALECCCNV